MGRILPAEVMDARAQAAAIVAAAEARAQTIRREAETAREQARREGYQAGLDAGAATVTVTLLAAAAEAERVRAAADRAAAAPLTERAVPIAVKMAEKIVGRAIQLSPTLLADLAGQALAAAGGARAPLVRLRVHPEDLPILERDEHRRRLVARIGAGRELRLVADPAVGRYGCVIEAGALRLDARLDSQLAALERALLGDGSDRG
jgi:flagellar biosynthesis/type III secretory pathway protein FliH